MVATNSLYLQQHGARERVQALAAQMLERDREPREAMLAYQQARLREMVRHAIGNSPYYRQAIGDAGDGDIGLDALPILTKGTLMAHFDAIVTDRRLRLADLEEHLAGERAAESLFGEYRVVGSGGTTGQRGVVVYDQAAWDVALAAILRGMAIQQISPTGRVIGIGAPTPLHLSNRLFAELHGERADVPRLAVTTPLPEVVAALNAYQPEVVITYPTLIRRLAEEQLAGRLRIAPQKLGAVAECLTHDIRDLAHRAWQAPVLDSYGTTEAGVIGMECPWTSGLHVVEDLVIVEVVDENDRPVPPGVCGHKVLVTNLYNRALPFIRYELSDLVAVAEGPCRCGRPHLRLASIQGRREDVLSLRARNGGLVNVHAFLLGETLLHIPAIRQYQLHQRPDGLDVRVVLRDAKHGTAALESARLAIQAELDKVGAVVEKLTVNAVDDIPRVGTGAKEKPLSR